MDNLAMAHSSWNDEDYDNQFWPMLRETVDTLLLKPSYEPFSYEKMYSAVYKCVCKHQAERLHSDLMCHVESIVKKWSQSLHQLRQSGDSIGFIREFHQILTQFFSALASIVPIFIYLNRFYVESRLNTSLITQFHQLFVKNLSDSHVQDILQCLESAPPLSFSPSVVQSILKNLNTLNPQYCQINVTLFSKHLPGILAPMGEADLQLQIQADKMLQQQLREAGFESGGRGLKRSNSDLEPNQVRT